MGNLPPKTFYEGTAIKITTVLNIDTPESAKITIKDSSDAVKIDSADMTRAADKVYYYIYQSDRANDHGRFKITIRVVYGGYTGLVEDYFDLVEVEA